MALSNSAPSQQIKQHTVIPFLAINTALVIIALSNKKQARKKKGTNQDSKNIALYPLSSLLSTKKKLESWKHSWRQEQPLPLERYCFLPNLDHLKFRHSLPLSGDTSILSRARGG